jgi:hypothetical protein
MLIDFIFSNRPSFSDLCTALGQYVSVIIGEVIWCDGFYAKYMDDIIEINIFSDAVTKESILDYLQPLINNDKCTYINIQQGRFRLQYVLQPTENICGC